MFDNNRGIVCNNIKSLSRKLDMSTKFVGFVVRFGNNKKLGNLLQSLQELRLKELVWLSIKKS